MPSDSERKAAKAFKRHPAAIAQDVFDQSMPATYYDPSTLGKTQVYLTNRIHKAFQAGWEAAMKYVEAGRAKP